MLLNSLHKRSSILLSSILLVGSVCLSSCRKDHALTHFDENICYDLTDISYPIGDTMLSYPGMNYDNILLYIDNNQYHDIQLYAFEIDQNPGPGAAMTNKDYVLGNPLDSIGIQWSNDPEDLCARSLNAGDTLSPFTTLNDGSLLYCPSYLSGPCVDDRSVWYVGFVKIMNGSKFAGYIKINRISNTSLQSRKYWISRFAIASCAGKSIIVE